MAGSLFLVRSHLFIDPDYYTPRRHLSEDSTSMASFLVVIFWVTDSTLFTLTVYATSVVELGSAIAQIFQDYPGGKYLSVTEILIIYYCFECTVKYAQHREYVHLTICMSTSSWPSFLGNSASLNAFSKHCILIWVQVWNGM